MPSRSYALRLPVDGSRAHHRFVKPSARRAVMAGRTGCHRLRERRFPPAWRVVVWPAMLVSIRARRCGLGLAHHRRTSLGRRRRSRRRDWWDDRRPPPAAVSGLVVLRPHWWLPDADRAPVFGADRCRRGGRGDRAGIRQRPRCGPGRLELFRRRRGSTGNSANSAPPWAWSSGHPVVRQTLHLGLGDGEEGALPPPPQRWVVDFVALIPRIFDALPVPGAPVFIAAACGQPSPIPRFKPVTPNPLPSCWPTTCPTTLTATRR